MTTKIDQRGRYKTCTSCGYQFKFKTQEEKIEWKINNFKCPDCKIEYCSIHETDRKLLAIQKKYFESNRNEKYITEMYPILYDYAKSIILKRFRKLIISQSHLNDCIQSSITLFIEAYYFNKTDGVKYSFGGLLFYKVQEYILTEHKKLPKGIEEISLDYQFEDGNFIEYEDTKNVYSSIENEQNKQLICRYICNLLFAMKEKCESSKENFMRLQALYLYLIKGDNYKNKFFEIYKREGKYIFEETLALLKQELKLLYKNS